MDLCMTRKFYADLKEQPDEPLGEKNDSFLESLKNDSDDSGDFMDVAEVQEHEMHKSQDTLRRSMVNKLQLSGTFNKIAMQPVN